MDEMTFYAVVVLIPLLTAALIIFITNFTVLVFSAIEEDDEEFDFHAVRVIKYSRGVWRIDAGNCFDENAVIRLRFGYIFLTFFSGWDVIISARGCKRGTVVIKAEKNVRALRRMIRRSEI